MATHYTCDRCGEPADGKKPFSRQIVAMFPEQPPEHLIVEVTLKREATPFMTEPFERDLCDACRSRILRLAAGEDVSS